MFFYCKKKTLLLTEISSRTDVALNSYKQYSYHILLSFCHQSSPRTTTLSKHMLRVGRLASSDNPYSCAGGSLSSWQGHSSQAG